MFELLTLSAAAAYLLFVGLYLKTINIRSLMIFKFTPIVIALACAYLASKAGDAMLLIQ